jgi:hypothetical protein
MTAKPVGSELPIFTKTYDFLAWLVPVSNHFPRAQRHTVTQRLLDAAFNFQERLVRANTLRGQARLTELRAADVELDLVRHYLRLAHRWGWLSPGQYEHASHQEAEMGRLLGGWQKVTRDSLAGATAPETVGTG